MTDTTDHRPSVTRLNRDLRQASTTITEQEARYLVDAYYMMQDDRKRAHNQVRAMEAEPHMVVGWLAEQSELLENQIKISLDYYTGSHPVGQWMTSIFGVGPVIAAGLLAHIDIKKAVTAGHIWRFAGLDPTIVWNKGQKRPFNGDLKVLCWKIGQSFMKFSNKEDCTYGHMYRERKAYEIARNDSGGNKQAAADILEKKKIGKETDAYKHLSGGKLPPAQIDARARRYAVKMFLSHLHTVWFFIEFKRLPAQPYGLTQAGHAHFISPPNADQVPGLAEALREAGW